jgi:hypothetical protein
MAEIRIIYQIDNAAFDETPLPETKRILDEVKEGISNGSQGGLIQDIAGNGVGAWVIEGGEQRYKTCTRCAIDLSDDISDATLCEGCIADDEEETEHGLNTRTKDALLGR